VYPLFQFAEDRTSVPGLADVLATLAPAVHTPWTTASWLTSPHRRLQGQRPIDQRRRSEVAAVLTLATQAAADLRA
jgi:hypothetical protein